MATSNSPVIFQADSLSNDTGYHVLALSFSGLANFQLYPADYALSGGHTAEHRSGHTGVDSRRPHGVTWFAERLDSQSRCPCSSKHCFRTRLCPGASHRGFARNDPHRHLSTNASSQRTGGSSRGSASLSPGFIACSSVPYRRVRRLGAARSEEWLGSGLRSWV